MPMLTLTIDRNYVIVEGVRINRPSHIAPSHWLDIWEGLEIWEKDLIEEG